MSSASSGRARPTGVRRPKPAHAASSSHSSYSLLSFQAESMPTARMRLRRHACHLRAPAPGALSARGRARPRAHARACLGPPPPLPTPCRRSLGAARSGEPAQAGVVAARRRSRCCGRGPAVAQCRGPMSGSARVGSVPGA
jgi:hypothetical protein